MKDILKLAIPISMASMVGLLATLINVKIMGNASSYNLYLLSLFLPINFWVIALFESFKVPVSAVSAFAYGHEKFHLIGAQVASVLFVVFLGIIIPLLIIIAYPKAFSQVLSIDKQMDLSSFNKFAIYMLLASIFMSAFFIIIAVLRINA